MKSKAIVLVAGAIALGALLGVFILRIVDERISRPEMELAVGKPAPDFDLPVLGGDHAQLSDYRGKIVLVNFWATWCAPCKKEMPLFEARYRKHISDLVVVGINMGETGEQAQDFVDDLGITFPILLEKEGRSSADYNISGFPTTFVIDRNGILRSIYIGEMNAEQLDDALTKAGVKP